jgi:Tol biopolymer transport system component
LLNDSFSESQRWPQWSPDGSRLVFQAGQLSSESRSAPDSETLLYEAPALGGTARKLFASMPRRLAAGPSWSPDGSRIVFGGFDGLFVVPAQGDATPSLLVEDTQAHSPRWSPDGRAIAYVRGAPQFTFSEDSFGNTSNSALVLLTIADGRTHVITKGNALDTSPVWMPDGRTLLFISSRDGGRDVYAVPLSPAGQPEQEPRRLTSGSNAHTLSLARDGTLLAYSSYVPSANVWSVAIAPTGSVSVADARQVTFGNEKIEKLAISPDGQWLAYDSDRNGQADIWKMPLSGGAPEQVTRALNHEFVNEWSPDGRELVFHSMGEGGQRDVFVIAADGTGTQAVTTSAAEEQHAGWGPDGNTILFDSSTRGSTNQAYIVTRPSRGAPWGTPRQLTRNGSSDPKWSPDGRLVAFCLRGQLRVIAPDGSGERVVVDAQAGAIPQPSYAIWSADSATIYYKAYDRDRQSSIWAVPVAGGTPRLLVRFDDPSRRSLRREFATDGQRFYFTIARDESDIWMAELQRK